MMNNAGVNVDLTRVFTQVIPSHPYEVPFSLVVLTMSIKWYIFMW